MKRKIIKIDKELCNGCGLCVEACHEGAIGLVDGMAQLLRDDYCDGLGDCLPVCPTNAITFEDREAAAYDEEAVKENMKKKPLPCGCPGTHSRAIQRGHIESESVKTCPTEIPQSQLTQWPVQIKLVPVNAPYFNNADLLIAADCTAYSYANFHNEFMRDKTTIIGCPKLDDTDYSDKLTAILKNNNIKRLTIVRMEVPCCGGIVNMAVNALKDCGKMIPWQVITLSTDGEIIEK